MKEAFLNFSKEKNTHSFVINPERPFFKILRIEVPSIPEGVKNLPLHVPKFKLGYELSAADGKSFKGQIDSQSMEIISHTGKSPKFEFNAIILNDPKYERLHFNFENEGDEGEIKLVYSQQDYIELKDAGFYVHKRNSSFNPSTYLIKQKEDPFEDFGNHIAQNSNSKILFSAPFGQGKTTFLNYFFTINKDKYEVFKLYPVNYSVSYNEDIFKYIKAEILFQLFGKDIEFDKQNFNYLNTSFHFFQRDPTKVISPFLSLIPKIGKDLQEIQSKFSKLIQEYFKFHKDTQVDDEAEATRYIRDFYEKEGSIFEDNFYTQLIRQLLEQHKSKYGKKNVLIIDDVDRMDPDHIFRIFNVFSANFDSDHFNEGLTNKFNFDKVILVCDYTNIKKLFIHRYGSSYSFQGYLSKYYSKAPYYFDNKNTMDFIVNKFNFPYDRNRVSAHSSILIIILKDLVESGELTLRELLNLSKFDFTTELDTLYSKEAWTLSGHNKNLFFKIIAFLEKGFSKDDIIEKFSRCREYDSKKARIEYSRLTTIGFISLLEAPPSEEERYKISFKQRSYWFKMDEHKDPYLEHYYYEPKELTKDDHPSAINLTRDDFYDVLIQNVKKYKEI